MPKTGKKETRIRQKKRAGNYGYSPMMGQGMYDPMMGMYGQGMYGQGSNTTQEAPPTVVQGSKDLNTDVRNNTILGKIMIFFERIGRFISDYAKVASMYDNIDKFIITSVLENVAGDNVQPGMSPAMMPGMMPDMYGMQPGMMPGAQVSPVTMENGAMVQKNLLKEKVIDSMSKYSKKWYAILLILIIAFVVMPMVILLLSIVYASKLFPHFLNKGRFLGDYEKYREMASLINFFGIYIPDYIFGMWCICIVYIILLMFIYFSKFIDRKLVTFKASATKILILLGFCLLVLAFFSIVNHNKIQKIGQLRDNFDTTVYNYINMDYIEYLEGLNQQVCKECKDNNIISGTFQLILGKDSASKQKICPKCATNDILQVNSTKTFMRYMLGLYQEMQSKAAPTDVDSLTIEAFKAMKNEKNKRYYDLILNGVITCSILLKLKDNIYDDLNGRIINKDFFKNKNSLLPTISIDKYKLFEGNFDSCILLNFKGKSNTQEAIYIQQICKDLSGIQSEIHNLVIDIKNILNKVSFPMRLGASSVITVACVMYYLSFVFDVRALATPAQNPQNNMTMDQGYQGQYM